MGHAHDWEMDLKRAKLDINVMVWRCKHCGCLQIKNGGLSAKSTYRPNDPAWSPFKTLEDEPPCELPVRQTEPTRSKSSMGVTLKTRS